MAHKEWKQARELLVKSEHLFACSDLDLGKTFLIKHCIKLTDRTTFKEHYYQSSLHMYEDVKAHIQEMLDISAIWKLYSLWASTVVVVQKKDGSLRFCINLRILNSWTVKDAYALPKLMRPLTTCRHPSGSPCLT